MPFFDDVKAKEILNLLQKLPDEFFDIYYIVEITIKYFDWWKYTLVHALTLI